MTPPRTPSEAAELAEGIDPGPAFDEADAPPPVEDVAQADAVDAPPLTVDEVAKALRKGSAWLNEQYGEAVHANLTATELEVTLTAPGIAYILNSRPALRGAVRANPVVAAAVGASLYGMRVGKERKAFLDELERRVEAGEIPGPPSASTQPAPAARDDRPDDPQGEPPAGVPNPLAWMPAGGLA